MIIKREGVAVVTVVVIGEVRTVICVDRTGETNQVVTRVMATMPDHTSSAEVTSGDINQAHHLATTGDGVEVITGTTETEEVSGTTIASADMEVVIASLGVGRGTK